MTSEFASDSDGVVQVVLLLMLRLISMLNWVPLKETFLPRIRLEINLLVFLVSHLLLFLSTIYSSNDDDVASFTAYFSQKYHINSFLYSLLFLGLYMTRMSLEVVPSLTLLMSFSLAIKKMMMRVRENSLEMIIWSKKSHKYLATSLLLSITS